MRDQVSRLRAVTGLTVPNFAIKSDLTMAVRVARRSPDPAITRVEAARVESRAGHRNRVGNATPILMGIEPANVNFLTV
jgi:hypothetical protein